jgi:hypothetical protein
VIVEGNIADKANEYNVGYSFLLDTCNEFHCHGQDLAIHLFSDRHIRNLFIKGINNAQSIIWNQNALAMWARGVNRMHALLFLHMHFITGSPLYGEEYKNYFIHNTKHFNRTSYCSASTIMIF